MKVFISITEDLKKIYYEGKIVGWNYKRGMTKEDKEQIEKTLKKFQKGENELYDLSPTSGFSVNLIHIINLRKLDLPYSVTKLIKISDSEPLSENRTRAGGWAYIDTKKSKI